VYTAKRVVRIDLNRDSGGGRSGGCDLDDFTTTGVTRDAVRFERRLTGTTLVVLVSTLRITENSIQ